MLIADITVDLVKPPASNGAKNSEGKDPVSWEPDSEGDGYEEEPIVSDNDTSTLQDPSCKILEKGPQTGQRLIIGNQKFKTVKRNLLSRPTLILQGNSNHHSSRTDTHWGSEGAPPTPPSSRHQKSQGSQNGLMAECCCYIKFRISE